MTYEYMIEYIENYLESKGEKDSYKVFDGMSEYEIKKMYKEISKNSDFQYPIFQNALSYIVDENSELKEFAFNIIASYFTNETRKSICERIENELTPEFCAIILRKVFKAQAYLWFEDKKTKE